jgi:dCTP deaminase
MILPAQTIRALGILSPCCELTEHNGVTYGLGPAGYDLRISNDIQLWPSSSVRVDAVERFSMPDDVMGFLFSKSTWSRLHIEQAGTVINPGWRGVLRLEINMHFGEGPIEIKAGTGLVQVVFHRLEAATETPYSGKYQDQRRDQDAIFAPTDTAP